MTTHILQRLVPASADLRAWAKDAGLDALPLVWANVASFEDDIDAAWAHLYDLMGDPDIDGGETAFAIQSEYQIVTVSE